MKVRFLIFLFFLLMNVTISKNLFAENINNLLQMKRDESQKLIKFHYVADMKSVSGSDLNVIFLMKDQNLKNIDLSFSKEEIENLEKFLDKEKFIGEKEKLVHLPMMINGEYRNVLIFGLGEKKEIDEKKFESYGKKIANRAKLFKSKSISVFSNLKEYDFEIASNVGLGIAMNNFHFDLKNKKKDDEVNFPISDVKFLVNKDNVDKLNKKSKEQDALIKAINHVKIYSDTPANLLYPESFANFIKEDLKGLNVEIKILEKDEMAKLGMNALLGVAQAATFGPRLVVLEIKNGKKDEQPIAFVGKGVTFDSGGLSLKPADSMEGMKYDMSGAATVYGVMRVLAERKAKINAVGVLGLVENAVSGNAQRPGDVVMSMSGQTIEVLNTDAEGRLVLADAFTYTQRNYKPKIMIDLATLTGAAIVALGTNTNAAILSNNDEIAGKLVDCGKRTGEGLWRLPLQEIYNKKMDSKLADIQNISNSRGFGAGTITAAEFLQRFVEKDVQWVHLDIAGVDNRSSNSDCGDLNGSTAFGVKLLNEFVKQYENK
jgi:leucyl aminopeptidase